MDFDDVLLVWRVGRVLVSVLQNRRILPLFNRRWDAKNKQRGREEAMIASKTTSGETPSIHIMVAVVSPTTLQAPPALEAATIAAR